MVDIAKVYLWSDFVGAVAWQGNANTGYGVFEYAPSFLKKGLDISPIRMSVKDAVNADGIFAFKKRSKNSEEDTFKGLPGLLADALPDKFGNAIINAWLARQGRDVESFSPVERLCYAGTRAMGALEFKPTLNEKTDQSVPVEISRLAELAHEITSHRSTLDAAFGINDKHNEEALLEIMRVGTSAGGARAKAVIALNDDGHVLSGQSKAPEGYEHWLLKFDGAGDLEFGETQRYGRIEYAYYLMAKTCGINMMECRLLEEGGRAHFLTKRFDRQNNKKLHMQSLCGLGHFDYNMPGAYGYEQAFSVMRKLKIPQVEAAQQFRRMVFNVLARNQDDHTKNISFLMNKDGKWMLSPAYDVMFAYKPGNKWINSHQMTINGKQGDFVFDDFAQIARSINLTGYEDIINEVAEGVSQWQHFGKQAGIEPAKVKAIEGSFRFSLCEKERQNPSLEVSKDAMGMSPR